MIKAAKILRFRGLKRNSAPGRSRYFVEAAGVVVFHGGIKECISFCKEFGYTYQVED